MMPISLPLTRPQEACSTLPGSGMDPAQTGLPHSLSIGRGPQGRSISHVMFSLCLCPSSESVSGCLRAPAWEEDEQGARVSFMEAGTICSTVHVAESRAVHSLTGDNWGPPAWPCSSRLLCCWSRTWVALHSI